MKLCDAATGDYLALTVVDYQFGEVTDQYDSNWLRIQIDGSLDGRTWTCVDPCLETYDIEGLADWLTATAGAAAVPPPLNFTEPMLSFEVVGFPDGNVELNVWLELEARPPWAKKGFVDERDLAMELTVSPRDARNAASDLIAQLERFPTRKERSV